MATPDLAEIEATNASAYNSVAAEYDDSAHRTTRILERLSNVAISKWIRDEAVGSKHPSRVEPVLEVGCGTGCLTQLLIASHVAAEGLVAIDVSSNMLENAAQKLMEGRNAIGPTLIKASAFGRGPDYPVGPYRSVFAGLADPYFLPEALSYLRSVTRLGARLVFTLPEHEWAIRERHIRLRVDTNRTRFRLREGRVVFPYSFTYTPDELAAILVKSGFALLNCSVRSAIVPKQQGSGSLPPPAVLLGVAEVR